LLSQAGVYQTHIIARARSGSEWPCYPGFIAWAAGPQSAGGIGDDPPGESFWLLNWHFRETIWRWGSLGL